MSLEIIISIFSAIITAFSAVLTYINLREIRKQFFEQNRGQLVFYIDKSRNNSFFNLTLKNFGNSSAKLLSITTNPKIDWGKTSHSIPSSKNIDSCKNAFLPQTNFL